MDPGKLPPWKRARPPGQPSRLTRCQIEAARERASAAGRRYPNLVDNMWAARNVPRGEGEAPQVGEVAAEDAD
ncbi:hypothetical protein E2F46_00405 [Luteimonas aestuarii]|uniref:Uncharacterized protein n=1 Tax=Luteimonas aestuarii TaxID=453837 RepID=A0A4R5U4S4_9GAMM|nr:hypothetical protein [Luteimonas aestuarii]TDK28751.1 hypothetical protein E2F46_00405 [Luteimonas aestuarii]